MKCKDCEISVISTCPDCGKKVIICVEGNAGIVNYKHWDNDDGKFCDGIG